MAGDSTTNLILNQRLAGLSPQRRKLLEQLLQPKTKPVQALASIPRRDPSAGVSPSYAQERLWFLDQVAPGNPFYNVAFALRVQLNYDVPALERAINEIIQRHESLRTIFRSIDGRPIPVIVPSLRTPLAVVDMTDLPGLQREVEANRLAEAEAKTPFDLSQGPLVRAKLINLGDQKQVFLLTMHHIVSDYWSMQVFFRELGILYAAYVTGLPSPLPDLPIQYADFAVWQRQQLEGGQLAGQLQYWQEQLAEVPILALPTDHPRPPFQSYAGASHYMSVRYELIEQLRGLGQQSGTTLFMTLLAVFTALLQRYSGQSDIAIGTPIANRNRTEIEPLIGFFVNSLVLRLHASEDLSFAELLDQVRQVALAAYDNPDIPFELLVEELLSERDPSRSPLFQVSLQVLPVAHSVEIVQRSSFEKGTALNDLSFDFTESADNLLLRIEYSTDLFEADTIARMAKHYHNLLEQIVANPQKRLSELTLLSEDEQRLMLVDWNRTEAAYTHETCAHWLFEEQVKRTPEVVAVSFRTQSLTFRELNHKANQLARRLQKHGARPDVCIAICAERSLDLVVGILAILKSGAAYSPLDPDYPPERLRFLLDDLQAPVLLAQAHLCDRLPAFSGALLRFDVGSDTGSAEAEPNPHSDVTPSNLAYVLYTSGSTGRPKGVMVEHKALCNNLLWMQSQFPLLPDDAVPLKYSYSFDVSVWEILGPLIAGARLVVAEPWRSFDRDRFVDLIHQERITVLDLTPSMLQVLLESSAFCRTRSLRRITCGGEMMPAALRDETLRHLEVELNNMYGPTEATITATYWTCGPDEQTPTVPIGRPIGNTQVYVLDSHGKPVPVGVTGELYIGGECLARGYLNRESLTRERFCRNPFAEARGARLYRTGDLVRYRKDGNLEFVGRTDDQVKLRGVRIELGEIEVALRDHPGIQDVVVLAVDRSVSSRHTDMVQPLAEAIVQIGGVHSITLLEAVEALTEEEASFLLSQETSEEVRKNTMIRKDDDFEVFLHLSNPDFIQPPQQRQRNWTLQRVLDEFASDLKHLHEVTKRFVAGSERKAITSDWEGSKAQYQRSQLVIAEQQVMQDWERPLMQAMAQVVAKTHGDVLEVGFGMGISATYIQEFGVKSHTIIECNADVIEQYKHWRAGYPHADIRLVEGRWQDVVPELGTYDGVFFDTYPLDEEEFLHAVIDSMTFAEDFVPHAAELLRDGGIFTYYTNEIDSFSRRHQRLLLQYFKSMSLSLVRSLLPPEDCNYWWADSMVVVEAIK